MTSGMQSAKGSQRRAGRDSDLCGAGLHLSRAKPRETRHKPTGPCPSTACADPFRKLAPNGAEGSPPYDAHPKRELAPKVPNSNRSWYRLEFNISPTKQRTGVLSNRS